MALAQVHSKNPMVHDTSCKIWIPNSGQKQSLCLKWLSSCVHTAVSILDRLVLQGTLPVSGLHVDTARYHVSKAELAKHRFNN